MITMDNNDLSSITRINSNYNNRESTVTSSNDYMKAHTYIYIYTHVYIYIYTCLYIYISLYIIILQTYMRPLAPKEKKRFHDFATSCSTGFTFSWDDHNGSTLRWTLRWSYKSINPTNSKNTQCILYIYILHKLENDIRIVGKSINWKDIYIHIIIYIYVL